MTTQGPAATVEVVNQLVRAEPDAPAKGLKEDMGNVTEDSKVEEEIEAGKVNAMEVDQKDPPHPAVEEPAVSNKAEARESTAPAEVAAQVADTAKKLDATPVDGTPAASTPVPS